MQFWSFQIVDYTALDGWNCGYLYDQSLDILEGNQFVFTYTLSKYDEDNNNLTKIEVCFCSTAGVFRRASYPLEMWANTAAPKNSG